MLSCGVIDLVWANPGVHRLCLARVFPWGGVCLYYGVSPVLLLGSLTLRWSPSSLPCGGLKDPLGEAKTLFWGAGRYWVTVSLSHRSKSRYTLSCEPLYHVSLSAVHGSIMWVSLLCMTLSRESPFCALLYHVHLLCTALSCESPVHCSITWVQCPQRLEEGVGSSGAEYRWLWAIQNGC